MAEFGAHLTATTDVAPSIFEVLASESLADGLRAGFKYFVKVLCDHDPERYRQLFKFQDEVYTSFDFVIQWIHLNRLGGSFCENFYSLRRVPSTREEGTLPKRQFYLSLFCLVGVPYLRDKFLHWYLNLKRRNAVSAQLDALSRACLSCYPWLHLTFQLSLLSQQLGYSVGRTRVHSPLLLLADCQLTCLSQSEEEEENCNAFVKTLRWTVTLGAFTLQFLEWWYNQEGVTSLGALPIPPPPRKPLNLKIGYCPLCNKPFTNSTLLTTSGIVFCYRCIHEHLQESPVCPVTRYPSSQTELVKLYLPED